MQCAQCVSNHNIYLRAHILVYTGFTMRWVSSSLSSLEVLRDLFPRSPAVPITRDCGRRASRKSPTRAAFTSPLQSAVRGGQQGPSFMRCTAHIYIYVNQHICAWQQIACPLALHLVRTIARKFQSLMCSSHTKKSSLQRSAHIDSSHNSRTFAINQAHMLIDPTESAARIHLYIYIYILRDVAHPIQREGGECETKPSTGVE